MTTTQPQPTTTARDRRHRPLGQAASRTTASSRARATTSTTTRCPACCTWRSCGRRSRTRASRASTRRRRRRWTAWSRSSPASCSRSTTSRGCPRCRATPRRCSPPTRCGSRARRSRPSSPPTPTSPRTRSSSSTSTTRSSPPITTPQQALADGAALIRDDKEGQTDNLVYEWESGDEAATEAAFAKADRVVTLETHLPALAPVAAGDVRHPRRRQLGDRAGDDLHDVAGAARAPHACSRWWRGCPSRTSASSAPTSAAASATRCRCTRATSWRRRRRW